MIGVRNAIESVEDVGNIIVAQYGGSAIYLRDVATIRREAIFKTSALPSSPSKTKRENFHPLKIKSPSPSPNSKGPMPLLSPMPLKRN
jgi:hypothetical protein